MNKTQIYMLTKSEFLENKAKRESVAYENLMQANKTLFFLLYFIKKELFDLTLQNIKQ